MTNSAVTPVHFIACGEVDFPGSSGYFLSAFRERLLIQIAHSSEKSTKRRAVREENPFTKIWRAYRLLSMPCHSIHLPLKASNVSITRYIDDLGTFVTTFLLAEWLIRPNFRQTQHNSFSYHFFLTPPLKLSETFFLQGVEDLPVFCVSLPKRIENLAWYMKRSWAYFPFLDPNTLLSQMELPTLVSISIYLSLFRCEKNSPCTLVTISADRSSW